MVEGLPCCQVPEEGGWRLMQLDLQTVQDVAHHLYTVGAEKAGKVVEQLSEVELTWQLVVSLL